MVDRTATVEIARKDQSIIFRLRESDLETSDMFDYATLNVDATKLPPMTSMESLSAYGDQLTQALNSHVAVKQELQVFFNALNIDLASLQFSLSTSEAERFRWETLYTKPDFLAIKAHCSVKRIMPSGLRELPPPRIYESPVRMLAFLSPARVSSVSEFNAIVDELQKARAYAPIELTAYVGESALLEDIQRRCAAGELKHVTVGPMPSNTQDLEMILRQQPAQLLHFFCHGYLKDRVQLLNFATISDHEADEIEGSVNLSIERLGAVLRQCNTVWATVLNSCSGAQEVPGLYSMAATLTRTASPVTIGMAEQIHVADATLFAASFYREALIRIGQALGSTAPSKRATIDLGPAVAAARREMYDVARNGDPDGFRRWSLPVIYQREAGLQVATIDITTKSRIETVVKALRSLGSDTPPELREDILNILAKRPPVPKELWPDIYGTYK